MIPNSFLQVAAIEAVTLVIDSKLIPGNDVVDLLLPSVLANINVVGTPDEVRCQPIAAANSACLCILPNLLLPCTLTMSYAGC